MSRIYSLGIFSRFGGGGGPGGGKSKYIEIETIVMASVTYCVHKSFFFYQGQKFTKSNFIRGILRGRHLPTWSNSAMAYATYAPEDWTHDKNLILLHMLKYSFIYSKIRKRHKNEIITLESYLKQYNVSPHTKLFCLN